MLNDLINMIDDYITATGFPPESIVMPWDALRRVKIEGQDSECVEFFVSAARAEVQVLGIPVYFGNMSEILMCGRSYTLDGLDSRTVLG